MNYRTVADIFSQIGRIYDRFLGLATAGQIHTWQRDLIDTLGKEGNWLDIGTGTGEILKKLGDDYKGLRIGIDPALGMLEVAKGKCPGCHFVVALGESLPFKESIFSRISLSLVFRHLQDREAFLEEANRVLKPEGRIGIIDIGKFRGTGMILFFMKTLLLPFGLLIFGREKWNFFIHSVEESLSTDEVIELLSKHGFQVQTVEKRFFKAVYIMTAVKTA